MENQAETIYINDNGIQKIMCPFCGTLHSPTRKYYPSKSDAEDDAAAQCACDEAREWRKISVKKPMIRIRNQRTTACVLRRKIPSRVISCSQLQKEEQPWK